MPTSDADPLRQTLASALRQVRARRISVDFDEPGCRQALDQLARPLREQPGRRTEAAASLNAIGLIAAELLQHDLSIQLFSAAVAAAPAIAEYHLHLGSAHRFAGEPIPAIDAYRIALQLRPDWPKALVNLAETLDLAGHADEAIERFDRLQHLTGDSAQWQVNRGTVHLHQHHGDEAIAAFREAIALNPSHAAAHYKLAWALLTIGDFARGWPEYEWRTPPLEQARRIQRYPAPQWLGEPLHGKTLLLEAEQGLGDLLQFVRYARLLAEHGARVVVECPATLGRLLASVPGVTSVVQTSQPLPLHDCHVLPMSLPLHLRTIAETIPAQVPYLAAAPADTGRWRDRLDPAPGHGPQRPLRVGVAWAGNRLNRNDSRRSCPPPLFDRLAGVPGCAFVSLQKPQPFDVGKPARLRLLDPTALLDDLADTAGLLANLDLVITVDTALAHLAGALGKPVWILLSRFADWRWQWDRCDSPWYPTARLFRQPAPGDWASVLETVSAELRQRVSLGNSSAPPIESNE